MGLIEIVELHGEQEILSALELLKYNLFNQSLNDNQVLKNLAEKYAKHATVLVAKNNNLVVGICSFYCNDNDTHMGYLSMIMVKKEFRGCGCAKRLMNQMIKDCARTGMERIKLEVDNSNHVALCMYEKMHFKKELENGNKSYYVLNLGEEK